MIRYQAGDMEAFHQLYHRYEKKLYNYLLKSVGDAEKSADLFQEVFLKLHRLRITYHASRITFHVSRFTYSRSQNAWKKHAFASKSTVW
ncbi:hypothetical protein HYR99_00020 [Candidatus Poribacteria bacterium]|nr:hypothetical protein [Candidatus Poribacteria bacterium]